MLLHHILRLRLVSKENLNSDMDCHGDNNSNSVAILFCSYLPNGNQEEGREEEGKTREKKQNTTYGKYLFTSVISLKIG